MGSRIFWWALRHRKPMRHNAIRRLMAAGNSGWYLRCSSVFTAGTFVVAVLDERVAGDGCSMIWSRWLPSGQRAAGAAAAASTAARW